MQVEGKAHALREIAQIQAKAGDMRGALETAATIEDTSSKASALGAIAEAQVKAGDHAGAVMTRAQAQQAAAAIENADREADALRRIADAQATAGDVRGALKTATTIENAFKKADALRTIAAAQVTAKDSLGAARTFDQALEAAAAISNNVLGKAGAIALIGADRTEAGDMQGALAWAAAQSGDPVAKVSALVGVAVGVLQPAGRLGEARRLGDESYERLLPQWSNF
jgi:hypothetical protein